MTVRFLLVLWMMVVAALPSGAAPQVVDVLFVDSGDSSFAVAAAHFKSLVEKRSGGALKVRVHPGGRWDNKALDELGIVRAVQAGKPELAIVSSAPLTGYAAELEVVDVPFIFRDYAHVDNVLDGPVGTRLLGALSPRGLRGLAWLDCGFRVFSCSRPVTSLGAFRNLRVRVMQSPTYVSLVKAFKGVPVPSAVDKIHAMAAKGYIDAADRSYPTYWDFKLYEVQKYITETNHAYAAKVFVSNEAWFQSLSPALRKVVADAARESRIPQRKAFRKEVDRVKKAAAGRGVRIFVLSPAEHRAFVDASRPVVEQVKRQIGAGLVNQIEQSR